MLSWHQTLPSIRSLSMQWTDALFLRPSLPNRRLPFSDELAEVLDCFAEGLFIVDPRLRILYANAAIREIIDQPSKRLEGRSIDSLRWFNCIAYNRPWHASSLATDEEQLIGYEREDRSRRLLSVTVRPLECLSLDVPVKGALLISVRDATGLETYRAEMENLLARVRRSREEVQENNEQLQQLVTQDALTGCRNRRCLDQNAEEFWQACQQEQRSLACMMFDIDHFKSINDVHGHATGDEVLRRFGSSLRETFAGVGQVYRYGGEEFCVLLPGHDLTESRWIAERVRVSVSQIEVPSTATEELIHVTVSIGVSDRNAGGSDAAAMIDQADKCLYVAKRNGRNCVICYGPEVASAKFRSSDR